MVNLKFWKKDDFSDFKLPPMSTDTNLGLGGLGSRESAGGLDLTGSFQAPAGATMPTMPTTPNFSGNSFQDRPSFQSNQYTNPNSYAHDDHEPAAPAHMGKDLELIAAKLDAIKSQLDILNMRLNTLEQRLPPAQENNSGKKPWY